MNTNGHESKHLTADRCSVFNICRLDSPFAFIRAHLRLIAVFVAFVLLRVVEMELGSFLRAGHTSPIPPEGVKYPQITQISAFRSALPYDMDARVN